MNFLGMGKDCGWCGDESSSPSDSDSHSDSGSGSSSSQSASSSQSSSSSQSASSQSFSDIGGNLCCPILPRRWTWETSGLIPCHIGTVDFNGSWNLVNGPPTAQAALATSFSIGGIQLAEWHSAETGTGFAGAGFENGCLNSGGATALMHLWSMYLYHYSFGPGAGKCVYAVASARFYGVFGSFRNDLRHQFNNGVAQFNGWTTQGLWLPGTIDCVYDAGILGGGIGDNTTPISRQGNLSPA